MSSTKTNINGEGSKLKLGSSGSATNLPTPGGNQKVRGSFSNAQPKHAAPGGSQKLPSGSPKAPRVATPGGNQQVRKAK